MIPNCYIIVVITVSEADRKNNFFKGALIDSECPGQDHQARHK